MADPDAASLRSMASPKPKPKPKPQPKPQPTPQPTPRPKAATDLPSAQEQLAIRERMCSQREDALVAREQVLGNLKC